MSNEYSSQDLMNLLQPLLTQEEMEALNIPSSTSCESCVICVSDFKFDDEKLRELPCLHVFHENCLFTWLRFHPTCPLCRHVLKEHATGFLDVQPRVIMWDELRMRNIEYLSLRNILPGSDFYSGPAANTRSQIQARLNS